MEFYQIKSIEEFDSGERIILDFAEKINEDEGVLAGNSSELFALFLSENRESDGYEKREFRVNLGSLHQYVLLKDNKTKYLGEVIPTDSIAVYSNNGNERFLKVARVKREFRPLLRIELLNESKTCSIYCQNATTVHFVTEKGVKTLNNLSTSDKILCAKLRSARHQGQSIEEYLLEL